MRVSVGIERPLAWTGQFCDALFSEFEWAWRALPACDRQHGVVLKNGLWNLITDYSLGLTHKDTFYWHRGILFGD